MSTGSQYLRNDENTHLQAVGVNLLILSLVAISLKRINEYCNEINVEGMWLHNGVPERDVSFTLMRWQPLYTAVVLTEKVVEAHVVKMSDKNNNNN